METKSFCKEHKGYVIGGIATVVVLIIIASAFREFREERMGNFNKNFGNSYQRGNNEGEYEKNGNENFVSCGGKRLSNNKNGFENNQMMENKISLPLNAISIADASKIATTTIPGSKITQVYLENEEGILNYSFILDNKTEVKVDAINGKIVTDNIENQSNSSTGKTIK
ncbi:MAG: PepSY domain-containing protein [Candidatus Gracilibacteria bacterium]